MEKRGFRGKQETADKTYERKIKLCPVLGMSNGCLFSERLGSFTEYTQNRWGFDWGSLSSRPTNSPRRNLCLNENPFIYFWGILAFPTCLFLVLP